LAFRQLADRDADAEKLAGRARDARERDDRHSGPQSPQTDRARDAAGSKTLDEWELDTQDGGPSAAQSCAGRVEAVAQSGVLELAAAQLERPALPPLVQQAGQQFAASQDALAPECSLQAYLLLEQMWLAALQEVEVALQPEPCMQAVAGWSAQQFWARAEVRQQVLLVLQLLDAPRQARRPQVFPLLVERQAVMALREWKRPIAVFRGWLSGHLRAWRCWTNQFWA